MNDYACRRCLSTYRHVPVADASALCGECAAWLASRRERAEAAARRPGGFGDADAYERLLEAIDALPPLPEENLERIAALFARLDADARRARLKSKPEPEP